MKTARYGDTQITKVVKLPDKRGYFLLYHQLSMIHTNELGQNATSRKITEKTGAPPKVTEDELGRRRPTTLINSQK